MSGKYNHSGKRTFGSKSVFLMLALVLVIGCTIGGTLAWLTAKTDDVQNTFVAGQIGTLELEETDTDTTVAGEQHQYIVVPGVDIPKDPKVTYTQVTADGEITPVDAYVFVQLTQSNTGTSKWVWNATDAKYEIKNAKNEVVMSFAIDSNWTKLTVNGKEVFYKAVAKTDNGLSDVSIISGNTIDVSHLITEDDVDDIAKAADKLTFQAYAIQQAGFDSETDAWKEVSGANKTTGTP